MDHPLWIGRPIVIAVAQLHLGHVSFPLTVDEMQLTRSPQDNTLCLITPGENIAELLACQLLSHSLIYTE